MPELFEQRAKSSLLEMAVARQRVRNAFIFHHDEGNAVRQRPVFVAAKTVEVNAIFQKLARGGNNGCAGMMLNPIVKPDEDITITHPAQSIADFHQYPVRGDAMVADGAAGRQRLRMVRIGTRFIVLADNGRGWQKDRTEDFLFPQRARAACR